MNREQTLALAYRNIVRAKMYLELAKIHIDNGQVFNRDYKNCHDLIERIQTSIAESRDDWMRM